MIRIIMKRIEINPKTHFGKPIIKGARITVESVLELLAGGIEVDKVIKDYYPNLEKEDVITCLEYAANIIGKIKPPSNKKE